MDLIGPAMTYYVPPAQKKSPLLHLYFNRVKMHIQGMFDEFMKVNAFLLNLFLKSHMMRFHYRFLRQES